MQARAGAAKDGGKTGQEGGKDGAAGKDKDGKAGEEGKKDGEKEDHKAGSVMDAPALRSGFGSTCCWVANKAQM